MKTNIWSDIVIALCRQYLFEFDGYAANHGSDIYTWNLYKDAALLVSGVY